MVKNEKKKFALIGSTGSIGTQTLDIIDKYPELFGVSVLAAGSNVDKLVEQSKKYKPSLAIIADERKYNRLKEGLEGSGIEVASGSDAIIQSMKRDDFSSVITATVGFSGLEPTIQAIKSGKKIALANKETLVVAGELITGMLKGSESEIIPIDSEHSAIYQCIQGEDPQTIEKLIITASGGPFLNHTKEQLKNVTIQDALNHPRWKMGKKITVDSATMINKAFEIIEAHWLFNIAPEKIEAVVHPQSIVHSMVEFKDGSVKAQLGNPDMHVPISYALGETIRRETGTKRLSITDFASLSFSKPDTDKFPGLTLAYKALDRKGTLACIINAANEIAVNSFLNGKIDFSKIYPVIEQTITSMSITDNPEYSDYIETDKEARIKTEEIINKSAY